MSDSITKSSVKVFALNLANLTFAFVLIILDYSFPIQRPSILQSFLVLLYVIAICLIMIELVSNISEFVPELLGKIVEKKSLLGSPFFRRIRQYLVFTAVTLLCLILVLNIKTVGGFPSSPYASFLSSFPIFCVVMIFGEVKVMSCIKAFGLILAAFVVVEITAPLLGYKNVINISEVTSLRLSYAVLLITTLSNVFSLLISRDNDSSSSDID